MKKKMVPLSVLFIAVIAVLAACGGNQSNTNGASDTNAPDSKKVVRVGISPSYAPYAFIENEKPQGYEIDVLNAIAEKVGLTLEYNQGDFASLFGQLDSNKSDTIAHNVSITPERQEKYVFTNPHIISGAKFVVKKDDNAIQTLDDLKGKKLAVIMGNNLSKAVKAYNEEHKAGINLVEYEDPSGVYNEVALGRVDAFLVDKVTGLIQIEKTGLPLQVNGATDIVAYDSAFVFVKNEQNENLVEQFNQALEELRASGKLSEMSTKWLKVDISLPRQDNGK